MKGFLYILKSEKNNRYYIGSSTDWERRLAEHNDGKSTYTRTTRPWKLVYLHEYNSILLARREETSLKKKKSKGVIEELILSYSSRSSAG